MAGKLTKAQLAMLRFYEENGCTRHIFGSMNTWWSLINRGLLARSRGPGIVETEITPSGRAALEAGKE